MSMVAKKVKYCVYGELKYKKKFIIMYMLTFAVIPARRDNCESQIKVIYSNRTPAFWHCLIVVSGQTLAWTSPICSFFRKNMHNLDWPIPPPIH